MCPVLSRSSQTTVAWLMSSLCHYASSADWPTLYAVAVHASDWPTLSAVPENAPDWPAQYAVTVPAAHWSMLYAIAVNVPD